MPWEACQTLNGSWGYDRDNRDFKTAGQVIRMLVDGVSQKDLVVSRLAMLIEGQCEGLGAAKAAEKLELTKQRYFQLLKLYREQGSVGLQGHKPGPKRSRRHKGGSQIPRPKKRT